MWVKPVLVFTTHVKNCSGSAVRGSEVPRYSHGERGAEREQQKLQNGEMGTFSEGERATGKAAIGTRKGAKRVS